ncbi:hypothetical protein [Methanimicrococcus blatticola]|uniref:Uncharacterized protein n=1 Tax=Methanimicrococcus blatticola TaxID=91560 RepID=A0A484F6K5_9EURY|nr:hypothetical protein [Methanimicrococcus blatticola]MBZ3935610.1 hypothetical protein [Methanimicrococcus blatticola]MCC2509251.1 hypothetical protein [Methanimicrococcus blatticola]TDQ69383.1 hypothetical protein C7391_0708 [Methanimicrococcus blatticola]
MIGIKEFAYVAVASVALSIVLFAWYAFGAPLTGLDLTSDVNQLALVLGGVVVCGIAYALSKPDF